MLKGHRQRSWRQDGRAGEDAFSRGRKCRDMCLYIHCAPCLDKLLDDVPIAVGACERPLEPSVPPPSHSSHRLVRSTPSCEESSRLVACVDPNTGILKSAGSLSFYACPLGRSVLRSVLPQSPSRRSGGWSAIRTLSSGATGREWAYSRSACIRTTRWSPSRPSPGLSSRTARASIRRGPDRRNSAPAGR